MDFFSEYGDANRYKIQEVIGKGSYGVVCSAIDTHTGEKVAIKKIHDIFEHISDAARILREIKLLRLLRHPDIVEIKHIMLPPSRRDFKDIYVVFELMESDLHQVIKANDDLTREHYQFFLYQLLRALKYIHTAVDMVSRCHFAKKNSANVYHRDLKPKNILANANCKLKICDFGLARVAFNDTPSTVFWTDYVATRWYRAPELCGSFFSKLDLMTDLLGTPSLDTISLVRNDKARRYLTSMRKKQPIPLAQKFPNADPLALRLLERLLAFDPKDRPTAEEALADPYFKGLAKIEREPSCQPITKMEFEFERRRVTKEDVRELIFREILEYHPQLLKDYVNGTERTNFLYPSAVDQFRKQFAHLEENGGKSGPVIPLERKACISSQLSRYICARKRLKATVRRMNGWMHFIFGFRLFVLICVVWSTIVHSSSIPIKEQQNLASFKDRHTVEEACNKNPIDPEGIPVNISRILQAQQRIPLAKPGKVVGQVVSCENGSIMKDTYDPRTYMRSAGKQERSTMEAETDLPSQKQQVQQCGMAAKYVPDVAINIDSNPFFMTRIGASKVEHVDDRVMIDTSLLQAKAQYGGIGAASTAASTAAHRKIGTAQYGIRMF
ncbi:hypothetical protein OIU84_013496 [Salix udensis]|uniref:mitogen-activated protein kinase n=1 Tax=Salix udensis TaxID=889485 RepID=A0AAD6JJZ4_9ROSI|nr:hypothetical protein OIU84_013496 [Salix udensis]